MRRSAGWRVLWTLLALAGVSLASFLTIQMLSVHYLLERVNRELHAGVAPELVERMIVALGSGDEALREVFADLMAVNPTLELYLLDRDGRILASAVAAERIQLERIATEPIERFAERSKDEQILGDDPTEPGRPKPFSAAPVRVDGELRAYLYVVLGGGRYRDVVQMNQRRYALLLGGALLLLALGLGAGAAALRHATLVGRLHRLVLRVESFEREHGPSDPDEAGDELRRLERSFEELTARVAHQLRALERTDALRRELVAHVSHDLRASLTAVAGLIDTLRRPPTSLTPELRAKYLEAAGGRLEKLSHRVVQLLDLAQLEDPDSRPEWEVFSAAELVRDVVQDYELRAREAGIDLEPVARGTNHRAAGDIRMVERVLENLLDNALRHTPSGGRVEVAVEPEGDGVRIAVADSGPGIAAEPDPPRGSGLGLAIVRRILELHGAVLDVESAPERGSRFGFRLPGPGG